MSSEALEQEGKGSNEAEDARAKLKALLAAVPAGEEVVLSAELTELLRWRVVTWNKLPKPMVPLVLPFLTVQDTLGLDTALSERGDENERDHLQKAYKHLLSPGFDEWVYKGTKEGGFVGVQWARDRDINLQNLKVDYDGEKDASKVLGKLVVDENKEIATYYVPRSEARDTQVRLNGRESTTLIETTRLGYLDVAKCLMNRGVDVNKASNSGILTPLYGASYYGRLEVVRALLDAKAEANKADDSGKTPLYWASYEGHLEVVRALLDAEAEVNKADDYGTTPLSQALSRNHPQVAALLREAGAHA